VESPVLGDQYAGFGRGPAGNDRWKHRHRARRPTSPTSPCELVAMLARRLRTERRARGTRAGTRALSCWKQALMVLVWYRKREEMTVLAAGFGISRATAYRYRDEAITVLAEAAPDLHAALARVAEQGWAHVVLDGKLFRTDRAAATTTSQKGETINSWYSGKHRQPGGLVQAVMRPDG
jgi:hypothetical protein